MSVPVSQMSSIDPATQKYLDELRKLAAEDYERRKRPYVYEGNRLTPLTKEQTEAIAIARNPESYLPYLREAREKNDLASKGFPAGLQNYMNPYDRHVTNRIAEEGNRNLTEKILPALEAKFVRLGQHGGAAHRKLATQAARDIQSEISNRQNQALHSGYLSAAKIFNLDRDREMESAKVAASLGQMMQTSRMMDAEALMKAGQLARSAEQEREDLRFEDFLRGVTTPTEALKQYNALIRGLPYSTSTRTGYERFKPPSMRSRDYMGLGLNLMGRALPLFLKKGGHVKRRERPTSLKEISSFLNKEFDRSNSLRNF